MKRPVLISILGLIVLLSAGLLAFLTIEGRSPPVAPEAASEGGYDRERARQEARIAVAEAEARKAEAERAALKKAASVPSFDVVRIDAEGNAVMAGKATPGATVSILDGGQVIGEVKADGHGEWVYLPEKALPTGSRELSLRVVTPEGVTQESKDVVVLVVPEHKGEKTLAVRTDREGQGGSEVLQGAAPLSSEMAVTIDAVDYDEAGKIVASGRGPEKGVVHFYMDNTFLGRVVLDDRGHWRMSPEQAASAGSHVLRADLVDAQGKVVAREEIPFTRVEVNGMPEGVRVVVQPGNNLWLLARRAYGRGHAYTVIYDANKGQIRNPDLIYPGQIFVMPKDRSEELERQREKEASRKK